LTLKDRTERYIERYEKKINNKKKCYHCGSMMIKMGNTHRYECSNKKCLFLDHNILPYGIDLTFEINKLYRLQKEFEKIKDESYDDLWNGKKANHL